MVAPISLLASIVAEGVEAPLGQTLNV